MAINPIKLTVGFAMFDDFYGAYDTIQDIRLYHPEITEQIEIVVIDNNPDSVHSKEFQQFMGKVYDRTPPAAASGNGYRATLGGFQYVQLPHPRGTAAPRNEVFKVARGEWVICCDSHVKFPPKVIEKFLVWIRHNGNSNSLISGPIVYDQLDIYSDHFANFWRGQMWGTWSTTWKCLCGNYLFTCKDNEQGTVSYYPVSMNLKEIFRCPNCSMHFPSLMWSQHEKNLKSHDYKLVAEDDKEAKEFEIPGQGLGMFASRKDSWLGFNSKFRGFGGEEMYVHEKYRQAGRKNLCLPFLKWVHRFGRVGGVSAANGYNNWNKCRNYVIGLTEIGFSLDPVYEQFVKTKLLTETEWHILTHDPSNPPETPNDQVPQSKPIYEIQPIIDYSFAEVLDVSPIPKSSPGRVRSVTETILPAVSQGRSIAEVNNYPSIEKWFEVNKNRGHDFLAHQDYLKALAADSKVVMELGGRRGSSTVALLAGQPERLVVVDPNAGSEWMDLARLAGKTEFVNVSMRSEQYPLHPDSDEIDLLLIDTNHTKPQLLTELNKYAPKVLRRIVVHDTVLHATQGENGQLGLVEAIEEFLKNNPEWFIADHDPRQYGLTTLSRDERDKADSTKVSFSASVTNPQSISESMGEGPGTELKKLLASLGINPNPSCDCNGKARQMNQWGIQGCKENRETIIGWMRDGQTKWGWKDKLKATMNAVKSGLAFQLNPLDPFPGIIDECIRRAEEKSSTNYSEGGE